MDHEPDWTAADQQRADNFTEQIVGAAAELRGGHPDVIVIAFTQCLGSLMRERLLAQPDRAAFYARLLERLTRHVAAGVAAAPTEPMRH